jgi:hypothetical protein
MIEITINRFISGLYSHIPSENKNLTPTERLGFVQGLLGGQYP